MIFWFQLGLKPKFHQFDITDQKSLETFRDFIKNEHGGIDVLVNNAAIAYKVSDDGYNEHSIMSCHNMANANTNKLMICSYKAKGWTLSSNFLYR